MASGTVRAEFVMVTIGESYVERAEKALVETAILGELRKDASLSLDDLVQRVHAIGGFDEKVDRSFVKSAASRLGRGGHLVEQDGRYSLTDDGREDIAKIQGALCCVTSAEVPGVTVPDEYRGPAQRGMGGTLGP